MLLLLGCKEIKTGSAQQLFCKCYLILTSVISIIATQCMPRCVHMELTSLGCRILGYWGFPFHWFLLFHARGR